MTYDNLSIRLAERPTDGFVLGQTFYQDVQPAPASSDIEDGEILVETLYLSLDPAMRGWVRDQRSYLPPVPIGGVMRGFSACRVLASKSKRAAIDDIVTGFTGWTQYAVLADAQFEPLPTGLKHHSPKDLVSTLGITGLTAWWGMTQIANPQAGETVVVSAAAGATGSVAGQIAKLRGARVVGICGSQDKCSWLTNELGFDVALNYRTDDFEAKFAEATKEFINVYFDNVGGKVLDMCLGRAAPHARFVSCGAISQYNKSTPVLLENLGKISVMRIRLQGFIILDHKDRFPEAIRDLATWLREGKLKSSETVVRGGLQEAERALVGLFDGANTGKLLVEVKNPELPPANL